MTTHIDLSDPKAPTNPSQAKLSNFNKMNIEYNYYGHLDSILGEEWLSRHNLKG